MNRREFIGGSDVAAILGISPWTGRIQLWREKTGREEPKDISDEYHVSRGTMLEPMILARLEDHLYMRFERNVRFQGDFRSYLSGEVDGINRENKLIVEAKTMSKDAHENVAKGIIPEHYTAQIQFYLALSGADNCIVGSYNEKTDTLNLHSVARDDEYIQKMMDMVVKFWEINVLQDIEPEPSDLDICDLSAMDEYKQLAESAVELLARKKEVDESLSTVKKELNKLLSAHNIIRARGCGLMLTKYSRKGNVNYKKVPELQGVDLEPYRGKSVESFMMKLKEE